MNRLSLALLVSLALWCPGSGAADPQPREEGVEAPDYIWNEMYAEKLQALRAQGDPLRGEIAFEVCQGATAPGPLGASTAAIRVWQGSTPPCSSNR